MSSRRIRDLQDRIEKLRGLAIDKNRRPLYRYSHKGVEVLENEAWHWFVEMQLTSLEVAEIRSISKQRQQLGYASTLQPAPAEKATQDRVLYDRSVALLESAELRSEEILEREPMQWDSWLTYFESTAWPEMQEPVQEEVHDDEASEYLWDFKLRHWAAYKAMQKD